MQSFVSMPRVLCSCLFAMPGYHGIDEVEYTPDWDKLAMKLCHPELHVGARLE